MTDEELEKYNRPVTPEKLDRPDVPSMGSIAILEALDEIIEQEKSIRPISPHTIIYG